MDSEITLQLPPILCTQSASGGILEMAFFSGSHLIWMFGLGLHIPWSRCSLVHSCRPPSRNFRYLACAALIEVSETTSMCSPLGMFSAIQSIISVSWDAALCCPDNPLRGLSGSKD